MSHPKNCNWHHPVPLEGATINNQAAALGCSPSAVTLRRRLNAVNESFAARNNHRSNAANAAAPYRRFTNQLVNAYDRFPMLRPVFPLKFFVRVIGKLMIRAIVRDRNG